MLPLFSSLLFLLATKEAPSRAELSHGKKSLNSIDPLVSRALKERAMKRTQEGLLSNAALFMSYHEGR